VAPEPLGYLHRMRIGRPHISSGDLVAVALPKPAQRGQRSAASPASSAKAGFLSMKSRAARVRVCGSVGERFASSIAKSNSPASFAVANHLPSSPGVLWIRSRKIFADAFSGCFRKIAR